MGRRRTELLAATSVLAVLLTGCTVAGQGSPEHREEPEVLTVQATVPLPTATPSTTRAGRPRRWPTTDR